MKLHILRMFAIEMIASVRDLVQSQSFSVKTLMAMALLVTSVSVAAAAPADRVPDPQPPIVAEELDLMLMDFEIIWNQQPIFNDYLFCTSGLMYTDFIDPDGSDNQLSVVRLAITPGIGIGHSFTQLVYEGYHGSFWGPLTPGATHYFLRAIDSAGLTSEWIGADAGCSLLP